MWTRHPGAFRGLCRTAFQEQQPVFHMDAENPSRTHSAIGSDFFKTPSVLRTHLSNAPHQKPSAAACPMSGTPSRLRRLPMRVGSIPFTPMRKSCTPCARAPAGQLLRKKAFSTRMCNLPRRSVRCRLPMASLKRQRRKPFSTRMWKRLPGAFHRLPGPFPPRVRTALTSPRRNGKKSRP